jgi:hypothetical protein
LKSPGLIASTNCFARVLPWAKQGDKLKRYILPDGFQDDPYFCSLVLYNSCKYKILWLKFSFFLSYAILQQRPQYCLWRQTLICH